MTRRKKWFWGVMAVVWAGIIFACSNGVVLWRDFVRFMGRLVPGPNGEARFEAFWEKWWWLPTKGFHVMEFALLTYLTCLGLRKWKSEWPLRTVLIVSSFLGLLYACADEFHQTFIPQRGGRLTDVLIDLIGVSLAVGIFAWRSRSYQPQLKPASETK